MSKDIEKEKVIKEVEAHTEAHAEAHEGVHKILINNPSEYVIEVNDKGETISVDFSDVAQVKAFNEALLELDTLRAKMGKVAGELEDLGKQELPELKQSVESTNRLLEFLNEAYEIINLMFGEGATDKIFNGKKTVTGFYQFFDQIVPHLEKAMKKVSSVADDIAKKYEEKESNTKVLK